MEQMLGEGGQTYCSLGSVAGVEVVTVAVGSAAAA